MNSFRNVAFSLKQHLGITSRFVSCNLFIYDAVIANTLGGVQCYSLYIQDSNKGQSADHHVVKTIPPYVADTIVS